MSKKWMMWAAVPVLLLMSPWPAWLWWKQQATVRGPWTETGEELSLPAEPGPARTVPARVLQQDGEDQSFDAEEERSLDEVFVEELFWSGGLEERLGILCPWATDERRRLLTKDWVEALALLRYQHRLAKEAGGMEMALIGAPGDLLFSLMPDLGDEIDAGRAILRLPESPSLDPEFGSSTARFRLEPNEKTLVVEVQTRYGYFDLELGRDCGEPDLRTALWKESGLMWRSLVK